MNTRVITPAVTRGRTLSREVAVPVRGVMHAAASYPPEFFRWIRKAQALDFLRLLLVMRGGGSDSARPENRPAVKPAAGRWVQRDGCTVRFTNGGLPGRSRIHVHRLPDSRIAGLFAAALLRTGVEGAAAPLDPEEWAGWQHAEDGRVSAPIALPLVIPLTDRREG